MNAIARAASAAAALAVLVALVGCAPDAPAPSDPPSSPAPSPSQSEAEPPSSPGPTGLSDAERQAVVDAVAAGDAAAVAAAMGDPVTYILASSECCGPLPPSDAAAELVSYTSGETGWTSPADPAFVDQVRLSAYYADYVPEDVISMRASSTLIVILGVSGTTIGSVLVGTETTLLY